MTRLRLVAWLIVLWALDDYRDWSYRLARPELLPLARQAFATLSKNRMALSEWCDGSPGCKV